MREARGAGVGRKSGRQTSEQMSYGERKKMGDAGTWGETERENEGWMMGMTAKGWRQSQDGGMWRA